MAKSPAPPRADVRRRPSRRPIPVSPDGCEHGEHLVGAIRDAERKRLLTVLADLRAREAKRKANDSMLRGVERWADRLGMTSAVSAALRATVRAESLVAVEFTDDVDEPSAVALFVAVASRSADDDLILEVLREGDVMSAGDRQRGLGALRKRREEFKKWAERARAAMLAANPRLA